MPTPPYPILHALLLPIISGANREPPCRLEKDRRRLVAVKEIGVDLDILSPLFRHCRLFKDGRDRASRLTCPAVDTLIRVDIELLSRLEIFLVLSGVNAVNRADIHAGCVLHANARLSDYVCHGSEYPPTGSPCENSDNMHGGNVVFSFKCSIEVCGRNVNRIHQDFRVATALDKTHNDWV
jgi:hypothetical protein